MSMIARSLIYHYKFWNTMTLEIKKKMYMDGEKCLIKNKKIYENLVGKTLLSSFLDLPDVALYHREKRRALEDRTSPDATIGSLGA